MIYAAAMSRARSATVNNNMDFIFVRSPLNFWGEFFHSNESRAGSPDWRGAIERDSKQVNSMLKGPQVIKTTQFSLIVNDK